MHAIRRCRANEKPAILEIINAAAEAYRGVIPADRWHDPYMPVSQLDRDIAAGVEFWGYELQGMLIGVMGIQRVRDVDLIRHAYVRRGSQRLGVGTALINHLRALSGRRMLVGTWADAAWAIRFYEREGFVRVDAPRAAELLETYWDIPERQIATSVVLEGASAESCP